MSTDASSAVQTVIDNIPEIVVTEPSPAVGNQSVTSVSIQEAAINQEGCMDELESQKQVKPQNSVPVETTAPVQERNSSGEFSSAEECVVSVVDVAASEQAEPTPGSSVTDPDEFRTYGCCQFNIDFQGPYDYLWSIFESRYAIPFWLLAMSVPVSAGIMGAIYMFKCPAADSLPNMVFMIGISLMAIFTLRVCIIIHRLTWVDENSRSMLQTMNLICLFITSLFFITESATFWQMTSSTHPGAENFCHPTFSTYVFWWNIATSLFMGLILIFPIA